MSCYTWIYRRVDSLTEEYKKSEVEKAIIEYGNAYILKVSKDVYMNEKKRTSKKPYTEGHYESDVAIAKGKVESLKNEGFPYLLTLKTDKDFNLIIRDVSILYYNISCDFPFRISGSSSEEFTDKESLLNWAEKYSKTHELEWFDDSVNEWFKGYSDGFRNMIEKYFKDNGENNLYIEFR